MNRPVVSLGQMLRVEKLQADRARSNAVISVAISVMVTVGLLLWLWPSPVVIVQPCGSGEESSPMRPMVPHTRPPTST